MDWKEAACASFISLCVAAFLCVFVIHGADCSKVNRAAKEKTRQHAIDKGAIIVEHMP